ncbi:hypothetical protein R3P38DRAFT_3208423 [Favolaschia claudopus]|uniref:Uncharacterized protein n=1 Tax=Favolaschia claudopus TaxID=2862362 RepID=A0AAW0AK29_9AGAR
MSSLPGFVQRDKTSAPLIQCAFLWNATTTTTPNLKSLSRTSTKGWDSRNVIGAYGLTKQDATHPQKTRVDGLGPVGAYLSHPRSSTTPRRTGTPAANAGMQTGWLNGCSSLACDSVAVSIIIRKFQPALTSVERGEFLVAATSVERATSRATRSPPGELQVAATSVERVNHHREFQLASPPVVERGGFQPVSTSVERAISRSSPGLIEFNSALVISSPPRAPSSEPGTFQVTATSVERILACGSVAPSILVSRFSVPRLFISRSPLVASTLYARCIPVGAALVTDDALIRYSSFDARNIYSLV